MWGSSYLGDASAVVVREGFSHGHGAPTPSVELPLSSTAASFCDESADAITVNGGIVAMAGSLSLSGDVTLESDGSDIVTINGVFCCRHADCLGSHHVERSDVEHGHGWSRQRGNRLHDDLRFDNFINALTVVQGAITLGNEATDVSAVAGRHDLRLICTFNV